MAGLVVLLLGAATALFGPRLRYGQPVTAPAWAAGINQDKLTSEYCISCHAEAGAQWRDSLHHLANRPFDHRAPAADFITAGTSTFAADYRFSKDELHAVIEETRRDGSVHRHQPAMVIGHGTLRQFLIETKPGAFQSTEVAWDPAKHEWFDTFKRDERHPGEWGHWTGQSMNWNSMCARCHMTAYDKGYDEAAGRYRSRWAEHGIGCVQCHGPMSGHERGGAAMAGVPNFAKDPTRMIQTCAPCHARAEDLTSSFPPGAKFEDHFRLQLMTDSRFYFADGQIRDEVFEWGSFQHSKMAAAGVTCLDCHNAHTGKLRLPLENNSLCLQCHAPGNTRKATVIDPEKHSFHPSGSVGNRCVECHMVETTYMARDPRRDHGFIIPDPLLNKELGIPDACSRCHADQSVEWNIAAWEKWYGSSPLTAARRARTRAVAQAYAGNPAVVPELLRLIGEEKTKGWRASLLSLAGMLAPTDDAVIAAAGSLRHDPEPVIRSTAVQALANREHTLPLVREALQDPVRLVRLDAAWALSPELTDNSPMRRELDDYLNVFAENPVSLMRRGQDRFRRGQHDPGLTDLRKAIELDPLSAPIPETLGYMLNTVGRTREAAESFEKAAKLSPTDPVAAQNAALTWAEAGDISRAEAMFREAVRRDPTRGRMWYNLGLLLNQTGRAGEALQILSQAEMATPQDPDIPYAAATIHFQLGQVPQAKAAAERALAISPAYQPAAGLLRQLGPR